MSRTKTLKCVFISMQNMFGKRVSFRVSIIVCLF